MKTSHHPVQPARKDLDFDIDELLHPAQAFDHPRDVVNDPDLTLNEKRAILASWASDACAVEAAPALRHPPGARQAVGVDEILQALRALDRQVSAAMSPAPWTRRQVRRQSFEEFRARRAREQQGSGATH